MWELREGLRKRGESWHKWPDENSTTWQAYSNPHTATESMDGTLIVTGLTPEQAIAATLGRGECKVDVLNTGDCAGYECSEYIMHCNGCGHEFGHVLYNEDGDVWMSERPNFCPNCGCKVVDE